MDVTTKHRLTPCVELDAHKVSAVLALFCSSRAARRLHPAALTPHSQLEPSAHTICAQTGEHVKNWFLYRLYASLAHLANEFRAGDFFFATPAGEPYDDDVTNVRSAILIMPSVHWSASMAQRSKPVNRGFTVVELLTVVAVIALVITIGVGSWRMLMGTASVEGAQNLAGAVVGRTREEAMSLRRSRGVIFYSDARRDQVALAMIYHDDPAGRPVQIDLVPDADIQLLQSGVGTMFTNTADMQFSLPGVLLFDGYGQLYTRNFVIRFDGFLGRKMGLSADLEGTSHIGLTLFQVERFPAADLNQLTRLRSYQPAQVQSQWVNRYATSLLINRYNGQFIEGIKRQLP